MSIRCVAQHRSINFSNLLDCVHVFHMEFVMFISFISQISASIRPCHLVEHMTNEWTNEWNGWIRMNGRVFQFGQTQELACIPNESGRSGKREKKKIAFEHVHISGCGECVCVLCVCWIHILPFSWYFASNYMNYSGFWFNVFVINIFRHRHFDACFILVFRHQILYPDTVKEALSMAFDLAHYDLEHIYTFITIKNCAKTITRMQRIRDTFIQLSYEPNWSHTCRSLQFGNTHRKPTTTWK